MPSGVFQQALGDIANNYADVIEGGTTWRGSGTSYRGIPGRQSNDPGLRTGTDGSITQSAGTGTTTAVFYATGDWPNDRWVKTDTPGFFLLCTSATNADNVNAARRITTWNNTTKKFTVDALPSATTAGDVFTALHGFKRLPNQLDIEAADTEAADGYDRFFSIRIEPGQQLEYFGSGKATYKTELELRLRINKFGRHHDAAASALENLAIIRPIICKGASPDHRDGTYTMALIPTGNHAEKIKDDARKIVYKDSYTLIYRIDLTYA